MPKTPFLVQAEFRNPDETATFAAALAPLLVAGDVILLAGEIGAGKTHFARSLIQARLAAAERFEDVPSPTYTLVQTYDDGLCEIWHADLYRLSGPDDMIELGLIDAFSDAISLVEWPDRLGNLTPDDALTIELSMLPRSKGRRAVITGPAQGWQDRLKRALTVKTNV